MASRRRINTLVTTPRASLSTRWSVSCPDLEAKARTRKKWMRPSHVEGDTQIFEPGTLGSLPDQGGNISTYKEICSLATDLGQPDLIYQFMNLAAHQAAADASRGAAYGMASVAAIAGDELKEHVQALIPRLYRSTFDPNPLVRDSMRHIWLVLIDDQRSALKKHLGGHPVAALEGHDEAAMAGPRVCCPGHGGHFTGIDLGRTFGKRLKPS